MIRGYGCGTGWVSFRWALSSTQGLRFSEHLKLQMPRCPWCPRCTAEWKWKMLTLEQHLNVSFCKTTEVGSVECIESFFCIICTLAISRWMLLHRIACMYVYDMYMWKCHQMAMEFKSGHPNFFEATDHLIQKRSSKPTQNHWKAGLALLGLHLEVKLYKGGPYKLQLWKPGGTWDKETAETLGIRKARLSDPCQVIWSQSLTRFVQRKRPQSRSRKRWPMKGEMENNGERLRRGTGEA